MPAPIKSAKDLIHDLPIESQRHEGREDFFRTMPLLVPKSCILHRLRQKKYLTAKTPQYHLPELRGPGCGIYALLRQAKAAKIV